VEDQGPPAGGATPWGERSWVAGDCHAETKYINEWRGRNTKPRAERQNKIVKTKGNSLDRKNREMKEEDQKNLAQCQGNWLSGWGQTAEKRRRSETERGIKMAENVGVEPETNSDSWGRELVLGTYRVKKKAGKSRLGGTGKREKKERDTDNMKGQEVGASNREKKKQRRRRRERIAEKESRRCRGNWKRVGGNRNVGVKEKERSHNERTSRAGMGEADKKNGKKRPNLHNLDTHARQSHTR